jgi:hypothetical protein
MSLERLVLKYITSAEHVFRVMTVNETARSIAIDDVKKVVESAKAYLEDARYYRGMHKFDVSLTSIAYCEGLLDALRLLGAVKFEWPAKASMRETGK